MSQSLGLEGFSTLISYKISDFLLLINFMNSSVIELLLQHLLQDSTGSNQIPSSKTLWMLISVLWVLGDLETCEPAVRQLSSMLLGATSRKRKRNKAPKKHQRAVHMLRLARCDFASHTTRLFHASALLSRSNSNSKLQRKRPWCRSWKHVDVCYLMNHTQSSAWLPGQKR